VDRKDEGGSHGTHGNIGHKTTTSYADDSHRTSSTDVRGGKVTTEPLGVDQEGRTILQYRCHQCKVVNVSIYLWIDFIFGHRFCCGC